MIVVFFGQPCSGKTTLCKEFYSWMRDYLPVRIHYMDGDKFRGIFRNKDYSKQGRIANLNLASNIAKYERSLNEVVLMAFVFPYEECRAFLDTLEKKVMWVYLHYDKSNEIRGREDFWVDDFEVPNSSEYDLILDTSKLSIDECLDSVINTYRKLN